MELLYLRLHSRRPFSYRLHVRGFHFLCSLGYKSVALIEQVEDAGTGGADNTAHARGNRGVGDKAEEPYHTGIFNVRTSAELCGGGAYIHHSDLVAVLLVKECHCAALARGGNIGDNRLAGLCRKNVAVHNALDAVDLLGGERGEVSEVKSYLVLVDIGASLCNVGSENLAERRLKKVTCGV